MEVSKVVSIKSATPRAAPDLMLFSREKAGRIEKFLRLGVDGGKDKRADNAVSNHSTS